MCEDLYMLCVYFWAKISLIASAVRCRQLSWGKAQRRCILDLILNKSTQKVKPPAGQRGDPPFVLQFENGLRIISQNDFVSLVISSICMRYSGIHSSYLTSIRQ